MPLPIAPMKVACLSCGWCKVIPRQGDVTFMPSHCERCGSEKLTREAAGVLNSLNPLGFIFNILKK